MKNTESNFKTPSSTTVEDIFAWNPELTELGDAAELTLGNAIGSAIDPGVPPVGRRSHVISA